MLIDIYRYKRYTLITKGVAGKRLAEKHLSYENNRTLCRPAVIFYCPDIQ